MDLYLMAEGTAANASRSATATADQARADALRWFDELREPLRRYLMCAGANPADADEAVQESFLRFYQYLGKNRDIANVRGWVFQVARNYLRDQRKSAHRQRSVPLEDATGREAVFADPDGSPEYCALREERTRRLRLAVDRLPPPQRECILMRSSGLRYREIAEVMGINISGVGSLMHRALARLAEDLS